MTPVPLELLGLAHRLADASGVIIARYFRTPLTIEDKSDATPVTIADRQAEQVMRQLITTLYPEHGIYGEEMGITAQEAEYVWVLDPIDGTKSFMTGKPLFGTLIALLRWGKPILGILNQPILRERWVGGDGLPTTLNGQVIHVRACPTVQQAIVYATTPHMFEGQDAIAFTQVRETVKLTLYGCDCYASGLLAMGWVDAVVEASLKPYDYCALVPIIENAGGIMTDWAGQPLGLQSDGRIVAAGDKQLHATLLQTLRIEK